MTTRNKLIELIEKPIKEWLDQTSSIPKGTTYYAELMGCVQDSADELIKSRLIVDEKVYPPKCIIDEEYTTEFICDKCNTSVAFFTLCDRSFPYKQDILQNEKKVGNLKQLYPNYCSNCGCKLKE